MFRFYALLKKHFANSVRVLYTDTDSFFLQIFTEDLGHAIYSRPELREAFDFSEIPENHLSGLGSPNDPHAGEVGYFKDECKGDPIIEFIGLRPKMYSFTACKAVPPETPATVLKHKAVAKGITRANIRTLTHDDFDRMYREGPQTHIVNRRIGSKLHQVYDIVYFSCNFNNDNSLLFFRCTRLSKRSAVSARTTTSAICSLTCLMALRTHTLMSITHKNLIGEEQPVDDIPDEPGAELHI